MSSIDCSCIKPSAVSDTFKCDKHKNMNKPIPTCTHGCHFSRATGNRISESHCVQCVSSPDNWEEAFDEKFTNNPVFWSELVAEWHQGDVDVKPFKKFISAVRERERDKIEHLENQIDRLATFLMENYQDKIIEGGAVDVAINILEEKKEE